MSTFIVYWIQCVTHLLVYLKYKFLMYLHNIYSYSTKVDVVDICFTCMLCTTIYINKYLLFNKCVNYKNNYNCGDLLLKKKMVQ